ncbi:cyclopropyl isomerase [Striga asiatica]|uniref:Cyclopropyl isomerase n=1 Tax=Striga asiatica TaxID=4170 RepID=A0A5A7Q7B6_STRAF|nr:cyclopropyl isomerase [Striga asiatica]
MGGSEVGCSSSNLWFAQDPSKRWGEIFFLLYTPFWLTLCLGIVVPWKLYENFTEWEYLVLGLVSALPAFIIPMIIVGKVKLRDVFMSVVTTIVFLKFYQADSSKSWKDRYWVKDPTFCGSLARKHAVVFQSCLDFRPFVLHSISRDTSYLQFSLL